MNFYILFSLITLFWLGISFCSPTCFSKPYESGTSNIYSNVQSENIKQWFSDYDEIRREAQMTPTERQQADYFLSKITAIFVPGNEKILAKQLLNRMLERYRRAALNIRQLTVIPDAEKLQQGYYQYFVTAENLFSDYLKVQDNLLALDSVSGQPVATGLMERKQNLEDLERAVKNLDQQLRNQFGIVPYQY